MGMFFDKVITQYTTIGMAAIGYLFQRKLYVILLLFLVVGAIVCCLHPGCRAHFHEGSKMPNLFGHTYTQYFKST